MSRRLITFLTTRAQYARLKTVLQALETADDFESIIALAGGATAHNYGELAPILADDGIDPDYELTNLLEGGTPIAQAKTTGLELIEYSNVIEEVGPDGLIVTGDRYETMAATLAASYQNVPVCHFEGGEITGSIDEKVRHATTKMSDYHFVSTKRSARIVESMGEDPERVFRTGCPSIDIAATVAEQFHSEYDPQEEYGGVGGHVDISEPYIVVQYHPLPTEYRDNYEKTLELIHGVTDADKQAFWFWPNMDAGTDQVSKAIREFREEQDPDDIHFFINLEPEDYLSLVNDASCVVGNSSVAIRECAYFGTPAVNVGGRQQHRERASNVRDVPCEADAISEAIRDQVRHGRYEQSRIYGDGDAASHVLDSLRDISLTRKESMHPEHVGIE